MTPPPFNWFDYVIIVACAAACVVYTWKLGRPTKPRDYYLVQEDFRVDPSVTAPPDGWQGDAP